MFQNFLLKIEPSKITPFRTTMFSAWGEGIPPSPLNPPIFLYYHLRFREKFRKNFNKVAKFPLNFQNSQVSIDFRQKF